MNPVKFGSADAVVARMPSPKIWADCPILQFLADPAKGIHVFDDFHTLSCQDATTESGTFWYLFKDSGPSAVLAASREGHLNLDLGATEHDQITIVSGDLTAGLAKMPTKGERKKFWFEARVQMGVVAGTTAQSAFIGFAAVGAAADNQMILDTVALQDIDYLGFFANEADADDLTIVYNRLTATAGVAQSDTGEIALVVDTWIRVGLRLDVSTDKIHVYVDGVDQGADAEIDISSANFPYGTSLALTLSVKAGAGAPDNMLVDWVRFAQEY